MSTPGTHGDDPLQQALRVVLAMLPLGENATKEQVIDACDDVYSLYSRKGIPLDLGTLQTDALERYAVWQDPSTGLDDAEDHVEWLPEAKATLDWPFWDRYRRYLEETKLMPRQVVWRIDETTDRVLGKLENPQRPGRWRRDGLVAGQVQSGKTANYTGLICKAADAGYKLIVILAGIDNGLRSQTQLRIDEGFLGFDTQYQKRSDEDEHSFRIGVGNLTGSPRLAVASLTTSAENGDFGRGVAKNTNIPIGEYPVVLVVKKHVRILSYIRKWITEVHGHDIGQKKVVHDVPVLMIDDEADNASINLAKIDEDTDPSKVNAAIRDLLGSFDKAAYTGYTATPFANIYIDPDTQHQRYGLDIFPRHFIESLQPPSNYLSPERVFGLRSDEPDGEDITPVPIIRAVQDHDLWMPDKHRKDWTPPSALPGSVHEAVNAFLLACAARRARGQASEHNSMLIHVTRFQDVQERVADQVKDLVQLLRDRIRYGDANTPLPVEEELRRLWEADFVPTSAWFPADQAPPVSWEQVRDQIRPSIEKIQVRVVNGTSSDALQYYEHRHDGLSVIAIGGNKLSRGLTLEGLSVSYYLRESKTYDTLLQMGRWFGYRPRYEDLCRLYTTPALRDAYADITEGNDELRRTFDEMAALGAKPEEFGLRVRTSPIGLDITAPNKMRRGMKVRLSYSGDLVETVAFNLQIPALTKNLQVLKNLVTRLDSGYPWTGDGSVVWTGVPGEEIADAFLDEYVSSAALRVRSDFIAKYIRLCREVGELGNCTVRLVSSQMGATDEIGQHKIGLITRGAINKDEFATEGRYRIRRLVSPVDESTDLDDGQRARALAATRKAAEGKFGRDGTPRKAPELPTGTPLRRQRRPDQALLMLYPLVNPLGADMPPLIGYAISFPFSKHPTETEYIVNEVWLRQAFEESADLDEEPDE
jgi:hypothetical protein